MRAQHNLSTSAFDREGEASWRLWTMLNETRQTSSAVEPPDHLPLAQPGRCLLPDGFHFVCEAVAVSARGLKVTCEAAVDAGDAIVANFRGLGPIAGAVESQGDGWFTMDISATPEQLATLSRRILWSIRLKTEGAAERRMSVRFDQKRRKAMLKTIDGREVAGELLDLSATGAAVQLGVAAPFFWLGQQVALDGRSGRVRRHFPGGVGVEFDEARELEGPELLALDPSYST